MRLTSLQIALLLFVLLGIFFRLYNLDRKEFWEDEASALYAMSDVQPLSWGGSQAYWLKLDPSQYEKPFPAKDLAIYQTAAIKYNVNWVWQKIANTWSEHAPLFWCLSFSSLKAMGRSDIFALRLLPAVFGLLQIPLAYLLCLELFSTPLIALVTCSLIALSPTLIYYSQELREYSLFCSEVLFSSWVLLVALRKDKLVYWILFFLSMTLLFWSFILTYTVCISFFTFVVLTKGWRSRQFVKTVICMALAALTFVPWILNIVHDIPRITLYARWIFQTPPGRDLYSAMVGNITRTFADFESNTVYMCLVPVFVVLTVFCSYLLWRNGGKSARIFVLSLMFTCPVIWAAADIVLGGQRSLIARYSLPEFLGILIVVGYGLGFKMSTGTRNFQRFWINIGFLLLITEAISSGLMSQAVTWRYKWVVGNDMLPIANVLNKEIQPPLLVADYSDGQTCQELVGLYHYLKPEVKLLLITGPKDVLKRLPPEASRFYLLNASPETRAALATQGYKISPINDDYFFAARRQE